ncbi:MAG TPA: patatin-like phospholipase family protein [Thermoanaerobaculia bacterium]|nr:patatin-like phospholipase family protein [Thermoanaerobaculia bacterium]
MPPVHRATDFRRIALRATGGKVKAIFWHLGVRCALEARGFTFTSGFGPRTEPQRGEIGLLIGSSAGAIFSLLVAAGYDVPEILESFLGRKSRLPRIHDATIFRPHRHSLIGYLRRVRNAVNLRAGEVIFPGSGVGSLPDPEVQNIAAEYNLTLRKFLRHFKLKDLLVLRSRYSVSGMERWFHDLLDGHESFDELRTQLFILASDLDSPLTAVFGSREQDCQWYRYIAGVPVSHAAAASMAIPSVFNPVSINTGGRKHYFIDGDVYNPTETMIETDHGCDLAIISSFEAPYRFHPAIGSLHHLGLPFELSQTIALTIYSRFMQSRNAARAKWAGLQAARDALARHVDEETLERESKRIAAALDMSLQMKIIHVHPYKNPLLFFGNAFDLSPKSLGKMLVEASLQASDLLDREGFPLA